MCIKRCLCEYKGVYVYMKLFKCVYKVFWWIWSKVFICVWMCFRIYEGVFTYSISVLQGKAFT